MRLMRFAETVRKLPYRLSPGDDEHDGSGDDSSVVPHGTFPGEDLPYKVELWNESKTAIDQVLAVTANGSIGYAAYYAATREYPDRYITLRHKNGIVSRWNGPTN